MAGADQDAADTYTRVSCATRRCRAAAPRSARHLLILHACVRRRRITVPRTASISEFQANESDDAETLVKTHLAELARLAPPRRRRAAPAPTTSEAVVHWYFASHLRSFPADADAAKTNFLLAELLFEDRRYAEAAVEYEKTAYDYLPHASSADAYAALPQPRGARQVSRRLPTGRRCSAAASRALRLWRRVRQRPARCVGAHRRRREAVHALGDAVPASGDGPGARVAAAGLEAQRRVVWTVVAHVAFERAEYGRAEQAYAEVLALTPPAQRAELVERPGGERVQAGQQGARRRRRRAACADRLRASRRSRRRSAKRRRAVRRRRGGADHAAGSGTAPQRIAGGLPASSEAYAAGRSPAEGSRLAYSKQKQWVQAAVELQRMSAAGGDREARAPRCGRRSSSTTRPRPIAAAAKAYTAYVARYRQPLELWRSRRAGGWRASPADGQRARELALMGDPAGRPQRRRGAHRAHALPRRERRAGGRRAGVRRLPQGRARRAARAPAQAEEGQARRRAQAYAVAADYGVADVTTAATFRLAALYQDFGKALLASQRPAKLSKKELEQYNVLLEEQAFRSRRRRSSCTNSTPGAPPTASTTSGVGRASPRCAS